MESKNIADMVAILILTASDTEFANLSISGIAYRFNIERNKLSREFKRKTKINLEDFLFKEKMIRAATFLKTKSNISVKEVSKRLGYFSYDYFIRKFKKFYGIPPGKYKEMCLANNLR